MFGKLSNGEMEKVLTEGYVGRLGCHADGRTYVVPITYAYDGKSFYFRTFEGLKLSMMRKNPKVCFQVDEMKDTANWKSVIAWGNFTELAGKERDKALKVLVSRNLPEISSEMVKISPTWPFPTDDFSQIKGVVFKIDVTEKTGRFEMIENHVYAK